MALQCGAFHISTAGPHLLQHHAAGPGRHRHPAGAGHAGRRRRHLGRRLHLQGQRHRALLPLRAAGQPPAPGVQALAGRCLRERAGRPGRDEPVPRRPGTALPDHRGEGLLHRRQPVGRHPRGQAAGAAGPVDGPGGADHGRRPLGRDRRHRPRDRLGPLRRGLAGGPQRPGARLPGRAGGRGQRHRRPPRPGHERPDREPDHRGQEPGHLRGPGHGPPAPGLRAAGQRHPQRGHHREPPHDGSPPGPAALRGALVRPPGADAAGAAAALGGLGRHRRGDRARCAGATTTRSSTPRAPT